MIFFCLFCREGHLDKGDRQHSAPLPPPQVQPPSKSMLCPKILLIISKDTQWNLIIETTYGLNTELVSILNQYFSETNFFSGQNW